MMLKRMLCIVAIPLTASPHSSGLAGTAAKVTAPAARLNYDAETWSSQKYTRELEQQQRKIVALEKRLAELEKILRGSELNPVRGRVATQDPAVTPVTLTTPVTPVTPVTPPAPAAIAAAASSNVRPGTAQAQAVTSVQGSPLFARRISIEQGLTYTHYDKRSLVLSGFLALDSILLGKINLQQIKTDNLQYDMTARLNVTDRLSIDVNTPFLYRRSNYFSPGAGGSAGAISDGTNHSKAIGDVNSGLYYQVQKSTAQSADWIASIRVRAPTGKHPFGVKLIKNSDPDNNNLLIPKSQPTGNGVWATSIGLAVVKSYDPVVLFSSIGYNYNFKRHFSDLSSTETTTSPGEVRLGNSWMLGAGFALALNDRTSINFAYSQSVQSASSLRGDEGPWTRQVGSESNSATFNAGLTHQLSEHWTMSSMIAMGLTPDSPNFSFSVKFPYTF